MRIASARVLSQRNSSHRARRYTLLDDASDGSPAPRDDHYPRRVYRRRRPGACGFRRQSAAPGRQHHGVQTHRAHLWRQVAKSAQGDRA